MKTKLIEKRTIEGQYDMPSDQMIIEHSEHGRLLVIDGFCGTDSPEGGAYRWKGGLVIKLQPGDTFKSLENEEWNDWATLYESVTNGHDDSRPVLMWDGWAIEKLANEALSR